MSWPAGPRSSTWCCDWLTEATVNSTLWRPRTGWDGQTVPLGHPDPAPAAYVLDGALAAVPAGRWASCTSAATGSPGATPAVPT